MVSPDVERHRTALRRSDLSKPVQCLLRDGILAGGYSFLDYGCGRGDDFRRLSDLGYDCAAWDPKHRPDGDRRESDVVNLGYVVNVIEDAIERAETLRRFWSFPHGSFTRQRGRLP